MQPHLSTPFHTLSTKVWNASQPHHHTTSLWGVGVWCGGRSGGAVDFHTSTPFHTLGTEMECFS